ncbi:hypothetical protein SAMN05428958_102520 [Pantoea sesami]|nr:hypothetical protein SAMN05428958_102520 [Pantoea sesami]
MANNRLSTEILINLAGNLQAKARQYGANMSEFASRHQRAMTVVTATTAAAGRGIDALGNRYTGMVAGIGSSLAVKQVADFDAQMRRMSTDTKMSLDRMEVFRKKIRDISNQPDIRIGASLHLEGAWGIMGKTGDENYAEENLRNLGLLMQAFGTDSEAASALFAQFWEKGVKGAKEVENVMDRLYGQFAIGSVSVSEMAQVAPKLLSVFPQGEEGIAQAGAFLQVFNKSKGGEAEATTSIVAMMAAINNKKNIEFLKNQGVDVYKKGTKEMKMPFELMLEILERAKYDPLKLQDVFDQTAMQGINSMLVQGRIPLMKKMIYGEVETGSTQKAAARNAESFNAAMQSLNNEWQRFSEKELAKPIQQLADALNTLDHETVDNWLNLGKQIAIAGAALVIARKTYQVGKGARDLFGAGKGKGIPKGVSDVFGSGVMPVYVVNMGSGGMSSSLPGGTATDGRPGVKNKHARGWAGKALAPLAVGIEGFDYLQSRYSLYDGVGDLTRQIAHNPDASQSSRDFATESQQNRQKMENLWSSITDWFTALGKDPAITDPRPWASSQQNPAYPPASVQGEIRVVVEGDARVKSVSMDTPGINLSASAGISSWRQD